MFADIATTLRENGFQLSDEQVCGRWKTLLVRSYKSVQDHNGKSGNSRKTHDYQSELDEIFKNDPCVTPAVTLSSSKRPRHQIKWNRILVLKRIRNWTHHCQHVHQPHPRDHHKQFLSQRKMGTKSLNQIIL